MGCASGIVRSLISLVLGVVIFVAFLGFLLASNFSDKLLSADLYIDTLAEENAAGKGLIITSVDMTITPTATATRDIHPKG